MSSGPKNAYEMEEERRHNDHCARLERLGISKIVEIVVDLRDTLRSMEEHQDITAMSRGGWARLDRINELLRKLA